MLNRAQPASIFSNCSGLGENEVEIAGRIWNQEEIQTLGPQKSEPSEAGTRMRDALEAAPGTSTLIFVEVLLLVELDVRPQSLHSAEKELRAQNSNTRGSLFRKSQR